MNSSKRKTNLGESRPSLQTQWPEGKKKKNKRKWTSAPSRGEVSFTPQEAQAAHLRLKNFLVRRRLVVSRLGNNAEAAEIGHYLDYLRALERELDIER